MGNKTVLVIDDSLTIRQQVTMTLKSAGYGTVEACNGREGIDAVRSGLPIAIVICDVNMPVANGLEFLETIKGDAPAPPVPVVMLTTDGSPELIARAKRAGAKGWIVKPFQSDLLLSAVRRIVGDRGV
ncbi:MAG: response regulator [Polyangia bacterium]|jgi:two-component system chemotaxis response regulator CheY